MKKLMIVCLGFILTACSTQTVSVDYDRNQDFSQLQDYKLVFEDNKGLTDLNLNRIKSAIQLDLQTKGITENENSSILLKIKPQEYYTEVQNSNVGIGMGGGNGGFGTSIGVGIPINSEKLNQQLLVSLYNQENQLVWDGRLEIQMPAEADAIVIEKNISKGVQKLFKNFPPENQIDK